MNNYPDVFSIDKIPMTKHTLHYSPYESKINKTTNVIQDNTVSYNDSRNKLWCNQRGYGNLVFGKNSSDNHVKINVKSYNRIPPLNVPYSSKVNSEMAWSSN